MEATPKPTGPFLRAAFFCEKVLIEKDNVKSFVRMIDQITHTHAGPDAPESLASFTYPFTLYVSLKAGTANGRCNYTLRMELPSGLSSTIATGSMNFPGAPNQGVDLISPMQLQFEHEGVYWFEFEVDGIVLTRMPLHVLYQRITPGTGQ